MRRVIDSLWYLFDIARCVVFVSPRRWRTEIEETTARSAGRGA